MTPTLSVRARFERFPATLKGAFIIRGEDPDPHQVALGPARIVPVTGGEGRPIAIAESTLDIAPKQDVFVPFETGVTELEPGWYELQLEAEVDGVRNTYPGGKRFSVAWPRGSTRRGSVPGGKVFKLDGVRVRLEQLECAADHVAVSLRTTPPSAVVVTLEASGQPLPVFDVQRDEETGALTLTAYPIRKTDPNLRVSVASGGSSASVDVPLP
ncbi:MAG: hypothetical protein ACXVQ0_01415 [Actinomycetota bacterium]